MKRPTKYKIIIISIIFFSIFFSASASVVQKSSISEVFDFGSVQEVNEFALLHNDAKTIDEDLDDKDIEITANNIVVSKTGSTQLFGNGNIRTEDLLVNFEKGNLVSQKKENGNDFLLQLQNDIRINNGNDSIIYAKSLLYGSGGDLHMQNARFINPDGGSLITKDITNGQKDIYIFRDGFFTACAISPEENDDIAEYLKYAPKMVADSEKWEKNKKDSHYKSDDNGAFFLDSLILNKKQTEYVDYEIVPKNKNYKELEADFNSINDKYRWSEWRMVIHDGIYNKKTSDATFYHTTFRIFNIPVLYLPKFMINLKNSNKPRSGLLPIQLISTGGGSQIGLSMPWYLRLSHNKDFLLTANIFQDISSVTGTGLKPNTTYDTRRYMANYYQFAYNHLISKKNGMLSKYSLKGSVTEQTQVIDYNNRQAIFDSNGGYRLGYRGHFRSKAIFSLTPTTTIKHRFLWISDPNYSLYYMRKFLPYHVNTLSIEDVQDRSFNKIEILSWTPMLLNYQLETAPTFVTQAMSFFRTKKDFLGGYGFTNNKVSYLNRSQGYSRVVGSGEVGYNINNIIHGTMIGFNNSFRGNAYDTFYTSGSVFNPSTQIFNSNLIIFGTYSQMLGNSLYMPGMSGGFGGSTLFSSQLIANHPIYKTFKYGTWTIDPMISWQNNFGTNYGFFTNEDSFTSRLDFDNLFEKNINNGLDGFANGSRISAGLKSSFITLSGYKIVVGGGLMETITNFGNNYFLPAQSGIYNNGLSNYVGTISITTPGNRIIISNNHRFDVSNGKLLESYTNISMLVIEKLLTFSVTHNYIDKSVLFLQHIQEYSAQMIGFFINLNITDNLKINFGGTQSLSPVNMQYYNPITNILVNNVLTNPWLFNSINVIYKTGCIEYGLTANQSFIAIPGMGSVWNVSFNINFAGL